MWKFRWNQWKIYTRTLKLRSWHLSFDRQDLLVRNISKTCRVLYFKLWPCLYPSFNVVTPCPTSFAKIIIICLNVSVTILYLFLFFYLLLIEHPYPDLRLLILSIIRSNIVGPFMVFYKILLRCSILSKSKNFTYSFYFLCNRTFVFSFSFFFWVLFPLFYS